MESAAFSFCFGSCGFSRGRVKQVAIRLMKGEAAMRLELWRQYKKAAMDLQHQAMIAMLEKQQKDSTQSTALSMLKKTQVTN